MFRKLLNYYRRPLADEQNTGRLSFQQYQSYAASGVNGNGGQGVRRTINATSLVTLAPGPTHKLNNPFVTGNLNSSLVVQPLQDNNSLTSF